MPACRFKQTLFLAKSAVNDQGVVQQDAIANLSELVIYVVFGAGVSAGVVKIEAAHAADYAGTWAVLATVTYAAASAVQEVAISGPHLAVRARVTTTIADGTVDAYAAGN